MAERIVRTCDICEMEFPSRDGWTFGRNAGQSSYAVKVRRTWWWYFKPDEKPDIHLICETCWNAMTDAAVQIKRGREGSDDASPVV